MHILQEDEEPLPDDELPEHLRPQPQIDMSQFDLQNNPEALLQASKKGKTLMTFVVVNGQPTRNEADEITKLWQTSLWNSHIQAERYMIDDNRAIFMFKDGTQGWTAKDFLIDQDRCESVTIENKVYPGKNSELKDEL
jgi:Chaperone for wingless signalling and trafficking of LDL receptor